MVAHVYNLYSLTIEYLFSYYFILFKLQYTGGPHASDFYQVLMWASGSKGSNKAFFFFYETESLLHQKQAYYWCRWPLKPNHCYTRNRHIIDVDGLWNRIIVTPDRRILLRFLEMLKFNVFQMFYSRRWWSTETSSWRSLDRSVEVVRQVSKIYISALTLLN